MSLYLLFSVLLWLTMLFEIARNKIRTGHYFSCMKSWSIWIFAINIFAFGGLIFLEIISEHQEDSAFKLMMLITILIYWVLKYIVRNIQLAQARAEKTQNLE